MIRFLLYFHYYDSVYTFFIDRIKEGFVLNRKHKIEGISVEIAIQHSRPGLAAVSKSGEPHAETTDQWLAIGLTHVLFYYVTFTIIMFFSFFI